MEDKNKILIDYVHHAFYGDYLEGLKGKYIYNNLIFPLEFVRIPSLSPLYDPEWQTNGYLYK